MGCAIFAHLICTPGAPFFFPLIVNHVVRAPYDQEMYLPRGRLRYSILPATKSMPKEMLPVVNKPLVQYGVEEALEAGLTEIGFVTGRGKRPLKTTLM